jgi:hypothetical protein
MVVELSVQVLLQAERMICAVYASKNCGQNTDSSFYIVNCFTIIELLFGLCLKACYFVPVLL